MPNEIDEESSVIATVLGGLLENFECQPVLFVGSGLSRRYLDTPDWPGALKVCLNAINSKNTTFDYLSQKHAGDPVKIGTEISDMIFEWAWHNRDNGYFPEAIYGHAQKAIFIKHVLSREIQKNNIEDAISDISPHAHEFEALKAIRPHAIITTNYDNMLEKIFTGYEAINGKQVLRQLYTLLSRPMSAYRLHKERSHEYQYHQPHLSRRSQGARAS